MSSALEGSTQHLPAATLSRTNSQRASQALALVDDSDPGLPGGADESAASGWGLADVLPVDDEVTPWNPSRQASLAASTRGQAGSGPAAARPPTAPGLSRPGSRGGVGSSGSTGAWWLRPPRPSSSHAREQSSIPPSPPLSPASRTRLLRGSSAGSGPSHPPAVAHAAANPGPPCHAGLEGCIPDSSPAGQPSPPASVSSTNAGQTAAGGVWGGDVQPAAPVTQQTPGLQRCHGSTTDPSQGPSLPLPPGGPTPAPADSPAALEETVACPGQGPRRGSSRQRQGSPSPLGFVRGAWGSTLASAWRVGREAGLRARSPSLSAGSPQPCGPPAVADIAQQLEMQDHQRQQWQQWQRRRRRQRQGLVCGQPVWAGLSLMSRVACLAVPVKGEEEEEGQVGVSSQGQAGGWGTQVSHSDQGQGWEGVEGQGWATQPFPARAPTYHLESLGAWGQQGERQQQQQGVREQQQGVRQQQQQGVRQQQQQGGRQQQQQGERQQQQQQQGVRQQQQGERQQQQQGERQQQQQQGVRQQQQGVRQQQQRGERQQQQGDMRQQQQRQQQGEKQEGEGVEQPEQSRGAAHQPQCGAGPAQAAGAAGPACLAVQGRQWPGRQQPHLGLTRQPGWPPGSDSRLTTASPAPAAPAAARPTAAWQPCLQAPPQRAGSACTAAAPSLQTLMKTTPTVLAAVAAHGSSCQQRVPHEALRVGAQRPGSAPQPLPPLAASLTFRPPWSPVEMAGRSLTGPQELPSPFEPCQLRPAILHHSTSSNSSQGFTASTNHPPYLQPGALHGNGTQIGSVARSALSSFSMLQHTTPARNAELRTWCTQARKAPDMCVHARSVVHCM